MILTCLCGSSYGKNIDFSSIYGIEFITYYSHLIMMETWLYSHKAHFNMICSTKKNVKFPNPAF